MIRHNIHYKNLFLLSLVHLILMINLVDLRHINIVHIPRATGVEVGLLGKM